MMTQQQAGTSRRSPHGAALRRLEPPSPQRAHPALAMIDFEHQGDERKRDERLAAMRAVGMPVFGLQGEHSFSEIVAEYRRCSAAFLTEQPHLAEGQLPALLKALERRPLH